MYVSPEKWMEWRVGIFSEGWVNYKCEHIFVHPLINYGFDRFQLQS